MAEEFDVLSVHTLAQRSRTSRPTATTRKTAIATYVSAGEGGNRTGLHNLKLNGKTMAFCWEMTSTKFYNFRNLHAYDAGAEWRIVYSNDSCEAYPGPKLWSVTFTGRSTKTPMAPRGSQNTSPDDSWETFWTQFRAAVQNRDRASLKRMLPSNFQDSAGGFSRDEWIRYIDRGKLWPNILKAMQTGTKTNSRAARSSRITKGDYAHYMILVFELGTDEQWRWVGNMVY